MAKCFNEKRVMAEAVKWGERGARLNSISSEIIVISLAIDEFNGVRGDFYKNITKGYEEKMNHFSSVVDKDYIVRYK